MFSSGDMIPGATLKKSFLEKKNGDLKCQARTCSRPFYLQCSSLPMFGGQGPNGVDGVPQRLSRYGNDNRNHSILFFLKLCCCC